MAVQFIDEMLKGARQVIANNADDMARGSGFWDDIKTGYRYSRSPRQAGVAVRRLKDSVNDMNLSEGTVASLYEDFGKRWGVDPRRALYEPDELVRDAIDLAKNNRGKLSNPTQYAGALLGKTRNIAGQTFINPWLNMAAFEIALPGLIWSGIDSLSFPKTNQQAMEMAMAQQQQMDLMNQVAMVEQLGKEAAQNSTTRDAILEVPQLSVPQINASQYYNY